MATTRIKNNQIDDATIVASSKVAAHSVTSGLLADNLTYDSNLTVTGNLTVNSAVAIGDITFDAASTIDLGGNKITNVADGSASQDVVTKNQLDAAQAGLLVKDACRAATDAALPAVIASGGPGVGKILTATSVGILTVDGVATVLGDRIIVKDQVAGVDNGIYKVTTEGTGGVAFVLTRATDYDGNPVGEVKAGTFSFVDEGTQNVKSGWTLTEVGLTGGGTPAVAVVDTDILTFAQFQGLPAYVAGTNLTLDGQTFNVDDAFLLNTGDDLAGNLLPSIDSTYDLGSVSFEWQNVYATTFIGALTGTASNAALLNTISSASFLRSDEADTHSATITPNSNNTINLGSASLNYANVYATTFIGALTGTASNADKLDNVNSTSFLRSDEADTHSFTITPNVTNTINLGSASLKYANVYATTFNGIATDADKLDAQDGTYYLDYTNFTNIPSILDAYTQDANVTVAPIATGTDSLAMGDGASTLSGASIAIGAGATTISADDIAIGNLAATGPSGDLTAQYRIAIGSFAVCDGFLATAVGYGAEARGDASVALGGADAREGDGVAIGNGARTGQTDAGSTERYSIAIGAGSRAYETDGIAIGHAASAGNISTSVDPSSIAIGAATQANHANSVAIGNGVISNADNTLIIGTSNANKITLNSSGNLTVSGVYIGDLVGNAATATKLATARTIDITGDITATAVAFDGTANIAISANVNNDSHTHDTRYFTETESDARYLRGNAADSHSGTITPSSNNTINLGSAVLKYANVYATTFQGESTSAQYADLAEMYTADAIIEPGTVVSFGGDAEVTTSTVDADRKVAGVVSTNPAYLMNSEAEGVAIALQGRVPCKVSGTIEKGDMLVADGNGGARAEADPQMGSVIGKALEASEGEAVIEVVVGRM